jgi:glycosyltransferase involved in cell wall biosynthesis
MATRDRATDGLKVSVIVPARNEEASIAVCLQSLVEQGGIGFEIVVVDDGSTDRTRQIAESFAGVRVVSPPPLPPSWTGKNNAVAAGARTAHSPWLLLTDADTIHRPGSLARALAEAEQKGVALLSYSPQQDVHGFWEKAVMPVIFAELAARYRPSEVSDPSSAAAAANGQYILVSREAYDAVGGHAAVASSLLEDVALARIVKASGRRIFFRYGGDAVRTRMYRSFAQLSEGWTKNLALLFPSPARLALVRTLEFLLILSGAALVLVWGLAGELRLALVTVAWVVAWYALLLKRIAKAHFSRDANVLALLGLPLFSYLLLRSKAAHAKGEVSWKGRDYRSAACALRSEPLGKPLARASS